MISFNKPYLNGKEHQNILEAIGSGHISGNGPFTKKCQSHLENRYGFKKCLLTTSCTDALEMAAILLDIKEGDEVIMPSFTFVSTANAFVLHGAKIVFADSREDHPGINEDQIESLITDRTRVIVPVHYAGIACNMDKIMEVAGRYNLYVVEDAAQAVDNFYTGGDGIKRVLGTIGHLSAFSFHETKNIHCGEGGMIAINDSRFTQRAEIIWEKGTNRVAFQKGEVNKYEWIDVGSSFLPSEINAAFLFAQIEDIESIQQKRSEIWNHYFLKMKPLAERGIIRLPYVPCYSGNNYHLFYILTDTRKKRDELMLFLKSKGIQSVFHYQSLHNSAFFRPKYTGCDLTNSDNYSNNLIRLPFYADLEKCAVDFITDEINSFFE
jgi:dTDP-4-amino-4,6-dideoxygalactose transaminase